MEHQPNSQVLENPRLLNKIQRLNESRELIKFYNNEPYDLSLKKIKEIEQANSIPNNKACSSQSQLNFEVLDYKQELLKKIKSSENIAKLLYYISLYESLQLTIQQQKHFDLKISCDKGLNYRIADCHFCGKRHFLKTSCNSFFCEDCRKYITSKIKRLAKKYIWNCNHFYATFTLPPEIQEKVDRWNKFFDKRYYKDKEGNLRFSEIYYTDLVYKSVNEAIFEYCKKRDLETGFILMPHSYGSLKLNFFFHLNVLISSKAIRVNPDKKIKTQRRYFQNRKLKTEKISLLGFRRIFGDDYSNFNSKKLNYQFDYNELRKIYKEKLERNFNVTIKDIPQIRFAKRKKSIYISYKKSINKVLNYFRHIPLNLKNIIKIENGYIYYQTSKAKEKKKIYKKPFKEFFYLIMQHIPPSNFRAVRQYGLYSNKNKKRLQYPTSPPKQKQSFRCDDCKTTLTKRNFIGLVHCGNLVWINSELKNNTSILDCKDFDWLKSINIEENGRVMQACEPPNSLKPKIQPNYPKFDETEYTDKHTGTRDYDGFGIDKIDLEKFSIIKIKTKIFEESEPEKIQKRLYRILNMEENNKIKLSQSERIDLSIIGRC